MQFVSKSCATRPVSGTPSIVVKWCFITVESSDQLPQARQKPGLAQPFEVKKRIGYLPETPPIYPEMDTSEYLKFVGKLKGLSGAELQKRVDYVCDRCAIADVRHKLLGKLSKGYRQRVGLAQAIIHNPDVLILDEPTAGLDPKQINETRDLIRGLAGDHTIILSTHILPEVEQTCEQVIIINK